MKKITQEIKNLRHRFSSRLLVINEINQVLLFHYMMHKDKSCWATPGGELEAGETYEDAAKRELFEETGFKIQSVGQPIWSTEFVFHLSDGEEVVAHENFFVVLVPSLKELSRVHWTANEHEVILEYKWWSIEELRNTTELVFPKNLVDLLERTKD